MLEIRRRATPLLLALLLGHLLLISTQVTTPSGVRVLEAAAFSVVSELQRAVSAVATGAAELWASYVALRGVREENDALKRRLADLEVRLQTERALARESRVLGDLLGLRMSLDLTTLSARVVAADPTPLFRTITIDRGAADGVRADMAVIAPAGVVGRVVGQVAPHAAKVQLLIDRTAAAGALIERSRAAGVVVGGDAGLRMEYVSNLADVRPGDVVVTSGVDGIYPKGFRIGQVDQVERGAGLYKTIRVRPAVEFASLELVLVVTTPPAAGGDGR
jgi:rod shape-determining protein MreC